MSVKRVKGGYRLGLSGKTYPTKKMAVAGAGANYTHGYSKPRVPQARRVVRIGGR